MQAEQAKGQIVSFIEAGKLAEADAAVDKLIADLPASLSKGQAIQQIAGAYQNAQQFDKAIKLSDYVLKNWPKGDFAVWAGMTVALSQTAKGDITAAEGTTERIISDYAGDTGLPAVLSIMADNYSWRKMYDRAERLYGVIKDKYPDSSWATKARLGLANARILALIEGGSYSPAAERLDLMVADFNETEGLPQMLLYIGQQFAWRGQFDKSKDVFDRLTEKFASSSFTQQARLWSARVNICALIERGKDEQALSGIDKMISDFKDDAGLPDALYRVSKEFEWVKGKAVAEGATRFDAPKGVYQRIAKEFGQTSYGQQAEWDQKRLAHRIKIFKLMDEADAKGVDAAIEQMAADFAGRPDIIASELCWIAHEYEKYPDKPEKASATWERAAVEFPESSEAKEAVSSAVRMAIEAEEKTGAKGAADDVVGRLRERLRGTPRFASLLYSAGEAYRVQAEIYERLKADPVRAKTCIEKAAELYSEVIRLSGESDPALQAYSRLGRCYQKLQRFSDALNLYKKIRGTWPGSQFEPNCLDGIGICYEELGKQGVVSSSEADYESEKAYRELVEKYPGYQRNMETLLKLGWLNFRQGKLQEAISWFEQGLAKFPKDSRPADVTYALARMYEETGQLEKAKQTYDELLRTCNDSAIAEAVRARLEKQSMDSQE
jgi:tetratricopeptide (TPR) repeat protein